MTELSPAAIAVDDALAACIQLQGEIVRARPLAAAALRAAADQVTPEDYSSYTGHPEHDFALEVRNDSVREAILAIADELEAQ
jgi:hypothetical protein